MSIARKIFAATIAFACCFAHAQELVNISYKTIEGNDATYEAIVSRPSSTQPKKHKAVVILHHAGGWGVGTTQQYARFFAENDYVTIEPRMFTIRSKPLIAFVPLAYSSLNYLAQDAAVDPAQISLMGLSIGGDLTVFSATEWAAKNYGTTTLSFAKFAPVYPVCWFHRSIIERKNESKFPAGFQDAFVKKPMKIFAGSADDYSSRDPADCQNFIDAIPDKTQKEMSSVVVYEGATHGWDQNSTSFREPRYGCKGQGCMIEMRSNPKVTQQAMKDLLDFFNEK